jgi:hypothetical protein
MDTVHYNSHIYSCCAAYLCQAKLLLATYNDETVNVDMDVNICNYKQAVDACRQWEKSSVCLAQYYDRVLGVMAEEERNSRGGYVCYTLFCVAGVLGRFVCLVLPVKSVANRQKYPCTLWGMVPFLISIRICNR